MISRDHTKLDQTKGLFTELQEAVNGAAPYMFKREMCIIDRKFLQARLNELEGGLPESIRQAAAIVLDEQNFRTTNRQACDEELGKAKTEAQRLSEEAQATLTQARTDAQQLRTQAEQEAQEILRKAQEDARRIGQQAEQEADQIRMDAQRQLREAISRENVLRMAQVEADEIRERAQNDAAQLHDNVFEYLNGVMSEIDRFMSESLKHVRSEQKELNEHRLQK